MITRKEAAIILYYLRQDFKIIPTSQKLAEKYSEELYNLLASCVLYLHSNFEDAKNQTISFIKKMFDSQNFKNYQANQQNEYKIYEAIIDRLNEIIKANVLTAKTIAKSV